MYQLFSSIPKEELDEYTGMEFNDFYVTMKTSFFQKNYNFIKHNNSTPIVVNVDEIDASKNLYSVMDEWEQSGLSGIHAHPNLDILLRGNIISEQEIDNLNVYGVIRNPIDRTISAAKMLHLKWFHLLYNGAAYPNISNSEAVKYMFDAIDKKDPRAKDAILAKPQTNWLIHNGRRINKIFKYENILDLVEELTGKREIKSNYHSDVRQDKSIDLPYELQQEILQRYAEDAALWESLP